MKAALFILFLLSILSAQPDWYPPERHQPYWHVGLSAASQLTSFYILHEVLNFRRDRAMLYSMPLGLVPGITKEIIDKRKNKIFNMEDIGYDTMGITVGISIVLIFNSFI